MLDGAEVAFARHGVRACTVDEIAAAAGLSRISVYRHVGPKDEVFRQVVLRNTRSYFERLEARFAKTNTLEAAVLALFEEAQQNYRRNPLYRTLLEREPEATLRMQTLDARGFYEQGVPWLAPRIVRFLAADADPAEAAEWIIRITISMVGTAGYLLDPYTPAALVRLAALTVRGLAVAGAPAPGATRGIS